MKFLKNRKISKSYIISIFCIFLAGLVSLFWHRGDFIISFGDFYFPQNGLSEFQRTIHSWDWISLGSSNFRVLGLSIPFGIFLSLTELMGLSQLSSQMIWNYLLFVSMGLSMFFLVTVVIKGYGTEFAGLFSAILFMFNPWVALNGAMFIPFVVFAPLLLALYIKGLDSKYKYYFAIFSAFIWWLTSASSLINLRNLAIHILLIFLYFVYYCSTNNKSKIIEAMKYSFVFIIVFFLLNFYWLLPVISNLGSVFSETANVYGTIGFEWKEAFSLNSAPVYELFRFLGHWSISDDFKGVSYVEWASIYSSIVFVIMGLLPVLLSAFGLGFVIFRRCFSKKYFFFIFLFLFGVFISMGKENYLLSFLSEKFSYISALFSLPFFYGGLFFVIAVSVLVGYSVFYIFNLNKKAGFVSIFFFCSIFLIYAFPIVNGDFIPKGNDIIGSGRYNIPEYYYDAQKEISSKRTDFRLFPLPYSKLGYYAYDWSPNGFNGPDMIESFLGKPIVSGVGVGNFLAEEAKDKNIKYEFLDEMLGLVNARYIFIREDGNLKFLENNPWYVIANDDFFGNKDRIMFDEISFIKIDDEHFLPKLYSPEEIFYPKRSIDKFIKILREGSSLKKPMVVFEFQNEKMDDDLKEIVNQLTESRLFEEKGPRSIEFKKIDPTKYRVRINGSNGQLPLVFSESFDKGWNVYLKERISSKKNPNSDLKKRGSLDVYKILDGNADEQANIEELNNFIEKGYITTLGNGKEKTIEHKKWENGKERLDYVEKYKIDFISKNFQGTIQNDNLPKGNIFETWFQKPALSEENHLVANGYANSWIIDVDEICREGVSSCVKNPDGTYDLELVVEFWSQRLFYVGLGISSVTLLGCLIFLAYGWRIRKRCGEAKKSLPADR